MSTSEAADRPSAVHAHQSANTQRKTNVPSNESSRSTRWRHACGRPTIKGKAASQQYLTPGEEDAVEDILLLWHSVDHALPPKSLLDLAWVIRRQRLCNSQSPATNDDIRPPHKNWPQGFYKRHPQLISRKCQALDSRRHENIQEKVAQWFTVIGEVLNDPAILPENVYNVDETGNMLNAPRPVKVIMSRHDRRNYKPARVQRTLVTAVECISADGRSLPPLIIWPAVTLRSSWTTHPTLGWHFACTPSGYNNSEIMLDWLKKVFDPLTKPRAGN